MICRAAYSLPAVLSLLLLTVAVVFAQPAHAACDSTIVFIPDDQLVYKLRAATGVSGPFLRASDLCALTTLDLQESYIYDIRGLEYCVNLETLKLGKNNLADITPLAGLTKLKTLELFETNVADISPLAGLTNLETLNLNQTAIYNLGPLTDHTKLNRLEFSQTDVATLAPLSGLSGLKYVNGSFTFVTDLTPLAGIALTTAMFNGSPLTSLAGVASTTSLSRLEISYTGVSDLALLVANASFATGDVLQVYFTPLTPTARCTQLETLESRGASAYTNEVCQLGADNNLCADAAEVEIGRTYGGDSTGATGTDISSCGTADDKDVWFQITPDGSYDLVATTQGSTLDTTLALFSGCGTGQLACNDDVAVGVFWSQVSWTAQAGVTYWLRVSGYNHLTGRYQLQVNLAACGSAGIIDIPDPGLETALREQLKKPTGPLLASDLCKVRALSLYGQYVSDLTGIEHCSNLTDLTIYRFGGLDFSPLASLTRLRECTLYYNDTMDSLEFLQNCPDLYRVFIDELPITSLHGLENKPLLGVLSIKNSPLEDISALASAAGLQYLTLNDTMVSDISPLSSCAALVDVDLAVNLITDLSPLSGLANLVEIGASYNGVSSLVGLQNLPQLTDLYVSGNALTSIPSLPGLSMLDTLYANSNSITDITNISSFAQLKMVDFGKNPIESGDLFVFNSLPNISYVDLGQTQVTTVDAFVGMASFATGDTLSLVGAPLTADTACNDLDIIRARGASVWADVSACGAPGSEDKCADAPYLSIGDATYGDLTGAGGTDLSTCGENLDLADVWYRINSPTARSVTVSTCGSEFDTTLAIFASCGGAQVACADDTCGDQEEITLDLVGGQNYLIRVSGFGGATGFYRVAVDPEPCGTGVEISFPDPALEGKVRLLIGRSTGPIYDSDVCGIANLSLTYSDITDLSGLRYFKALSFLQVYGNPDLIDISELAQMPWLISVDISSSQVASIAALRNLPRLSYVNVSYSDVRDLTPLLQNPGFATGASLNVNGTALGADTICNVLPVLAARGVNVFGAPSCIEASAVDECATTSLLIEEDEPVAGTFAGSTGADESSCGDDDTNDVWYLYFALDTDPTYFQMCDSEPGVTLSVFDGCGGPELLCAESQDVCGKTLPELVTSAGNMLLVRLSAAEGGAEEYGLVITKSADGGPGLPYGHTADINGDSLISLSELLRIIQFFNTGGFGCLAGTEDGYSPGGADHACAAHSADYKPQDWQVSLNELLRMIQFFNSGGYHACAGGEDGYCPGSGA